jgi:16S rRNA (guanine966-N2)-methyltransferase
MRVIGGTARGRRLIGPSSDGTRPLSDRAREALFNILGPGIREERVLDLYAGTGAVGLEALSRGAASATFVERDRRALGDIQANLDLLTFGDRATIVAGDALGWLLGRARGPWDVVFSGPPQYAGLWSQTLTALDQRLHLLDAGGVVTTQLDPSEDEGDPELEHLERVDERTYGRVLLLFHRPRQHSEPAAETAL